MKKIMYVLMALMVVGLVNASSGSHVEVDCGTNKWYDWNADLCRDYELQDEFNQVTDMIDDNNRRDNKQSNKIRNNKQDINSLDLFVSDKDAAWSSDGGIGLSRVREYVCKELIPLLKGIFTTKDEFSVLEDRIYNLEAKIFFLEQGKEPVGRDLFNKAVLLEMDATGKDVVDHDGYSCSMNGNSLICLG